MPNIICIGFVFPRCSATSFRRGNARSLFAQKATHPFATLLDLLSADVPAIGPPTRRPQESLLDRSHPNFIIIVCCALDALFTQLAGAATPASPGPNPPHAATRDSVGLLLRLLYRTPHPLRGELLAVLLQDHRIPSIALPRAAPPLNRPATGASPALSLTLSPSPQILTGTFRLTTSVDATGGLTAEGSVPRGNSGPPSPCSTPRGPGTMTPPTRAPGFSFLGAVDAASPGGSSADAGLGLPVAPPPVSVTWAQFVWALAHQMRRTVLHNYLRPCFLAWRWYHAQRSCLMRRQLRAAPAAPPRVIPTLLFAPPRSPMARPQGSLLHQWAQWHPAKEAAARRPSGGAALWRTCIEWASGLRQAQGGAAGGLLVEAAAPDGSPLQPRHLPPPPVPHHSPQDPAASPAASVLSLDPGACSGSPSGRVRHHHRHHHGPPPPRASALARTLVLMREEPSGPSLPASQTYLPPLAPGLRLGDPTRGYLPGVARQPSLCAGLCAAPWGPRCAWGGWGRWVRGRRWETWRAALAVCAGGMERRRRAWGAWRAALLGARRQRLADAFARWRAGVARTKAAASLQARASDHRAQETALLARRALRLWSAVSQVSHAHSRGLTEEAWCGWRAVFSRRATAVAVQGRAKARATRQAWEAWREQLARRQQFRERFQAHWLIRQVLAEWSAHTTGCLAARRLWLHRCWSRWVLYTRVCRRLRSGLKGLRMRKTFQALRNHAARRRLKKAHAEAALGFVASRYCRHLALTVFYQWRLVHRILKWRRRRTLILARGFFDRWRNFHSRAAEAREEAVALYTDQHRAITLVLTRYFQVIGGLPGLCANSVSYSICLLITVAFCFKKIQPKIIRNPWGWGFVGAAVIRSITNMLASRFGRALFVQLAGLTTPFFAALFSRLIEKKPLPRYTLLSAVLSSIGAFFVLAGPMVEGSKDWGFSGSDVVGMIISVCSSVCLACTFVFTRKLTAFHSDTIFAAQAVGAAICSLLMSVSLGENWAGWASASALTLAVFFTFAGGMLIANISQITSVKVVGSSNVSTLLPLRLVVTLGVGWLLLDEEVTSVLQYLGILAVCGVLAFYLIVQALDARRAKGLAASTTLGLESIPTPSSGPPGGSQKSPPPEGIEMMPLRKHPDPTAGDTTTSTFGGGSYGTNAPAPAGAPGPVTDDHFDVLSSDLKRPVPTTEPIAIPGAATLAESSNNAAQAASLDTLMAPPQLSDTTELPVAAPVPSRDPSPIAVAPSPARSPNGFPPSGSATGLFPIKTAAAIPRIPSSSHSAFTVFSKSPSAAGFSSASRASLSLVPSKAPLISVSSRSQLGSAAVLGAGPAPKAPITVLPVASPPGPAPTLAVPDSTALPIDPNLIALHGVLHPPAHMPEPASSAATTATVSTAELASTPPQGDVAASPPSLASTTGLSSPAASPPAAPVARKVPPPPPPKRPPPPPGRPIQG
ncbi:putative EamA/RhaT family transporter [Paratrimastix pyriformis]|uniref:EamA/RhaT family transporter n=1 Tax=Paratrimastix pyriformis TaxID=342808 RepID=A0ABQ8UPF4_9EUKA|nr:putative EamA/RhaT family transporter [Paratrimastix pyriformis]